MPPETKKSSATLRTSPYLIYNNQHFVLLLYQILLISGDMIPFKRCYILSHNKLSTVNIAKMNMRLLIQDIYNTKVCRRLGQ